MAESYLMALIGGKAGYSEVLMAQGGRCAICALRPDEAHKDAQRLAIDHDHETGMVRGLLCVRCNVGLGSFHDDVELLARAIEYVAHYQAAHAQAALDIPSKTLGIPSAQDVAAERWPAVGSARSCG